jgi:hypothetical protein
MLCPQTNCFSLYFRKNTTCLSVGLLRICQVFSVSCKTVCRWLRSNCCLTSDVILLLPRNGELCKCVAVLGLGSLVDTLESLSLVPVGVAFRHIAWVSRWYRQLHASRLECNAAPTRYKTEWKPLLASWGPLSPYRCGFRLVTSQVLSPAHGSRGWWWW